MMPGGGNSSTNYGAANATAGMGGVNTSLLTNHHQHVNQTQPQIMLGGASSASPDKDTSYGAYINA